MESRKEKNSMIGSKKPAIRSKRQDRAQFNPDRPVKRRLLAPARPQNLRRNCQVARPCTLGRYLVIEPGKREDYLSLAGYHYRSGEMGPYTSIFVLREKHPIRKIFSDPVGVIVYRMPQIHFAPRKHVFADQIAAGASTQLQTRLVNANIRCISRVVLDPRYRGLGLAARLVRETLPRSQVKVIEAAAVMGRVNPFFQKAGMKRVAAPMTAKKKTMIETLAYAGTEPAQYLDPQKVHDRLAKGKPEIRRLVDRQIKRFLSAYRHKGDMEDSPRRTAFVLKQLGTRPVYYYWINPDAQWKFE